MERPPIVFREWIYYETAARCWSNIIRHVLDGRPDGTWGNNGCYRYLYVAIQARISFNTNGYVGFGISTRDAERNRSRACVASVSRLPWDLSSRARKGGYRQND